MQLRHSALAKARYNISERLARWILMCHDRLRTNDLPFTHEFFALMLGVRRSGVTNEIHILEGVQPSRRPGETSRHSTGRSSKKSRAALTAFRTADMSATSGGQFAGHKPLSIDRSMHRLRGGIVGAEIHPAKCPKLSDEPSHLCGLWFTSVQGEEPKSYSATAHARTICSIIQLIK